MTGPNLHLDDTLGCVLVGALLSAVLYGCACSQSIFYLWNYRNDKISIKCLVAILWLLDTAQNMISCQSIWYYFVQNRGDIIGIMSLVPTFGAWQLVLSMTELAVHCFFISNIWRLMTNKWIRIPLTMAVASLCLTSFIMNILLVRKRWNMHYMAELEAEVKVNTFANLASTLASDTVISVSLAYILHRSRTGFRRTESIITKLVIYSANRGVIIFIVQLFVLVAYFWVQDNRLVVMILYMPLGDVYTNTSLAILNARRHVTASSYALSEIGRSIEMPTED
ncbi:uncharacterized protein LAESUDRAFT_809433 [Laetiporus sulphureus 93-53]|uniref:DUF6534 domain-containing protein n=1 Tax=Laetiporus sulphureus 93-53 TaxID=1314785 RepID=A0A165HBS3_9APHY|nr:uncharacterized protein LAESUDRAFT_809433 [Laetiporus sulphureus 93-53]KZT11518.1 hypothetical protein LAESUDRAFT_809433 [Laetiporus sulphureus 93-53]